MISIGSTIHFQQLDHAVLAHLFEQIALDFAHGIHFEHDLRVGFGGLIGIERMVFLITGIYRAPC